MVIYHFFWFHPHTLFLIHMWFHRLVNSVVVVDDVAKKIFFGHSNVKRVWPSAILHCSFLSLSLTHLLYLSLKEREEKQMFELSQLEDKFMYKSSMELLKYKVINAINCWNDNFMANCNLPFLQLWKM